MKQKTLKAQLNGLVLAMERDLNAIKSYKFKGKDEELMAALRRSFINASEAIGLQQLKMDSKKHNRVIDSPTPHEESSKPKRR